MYIARHNLAALLLAIPALFSSTVLEASAFPLQAKELQHGFQPDGAFVDKKGRRFDADNVDRVTVTVNYCLYPAPAFTVRDPRKTYHTLLSFRHLQST